MKNFVLILSLFCYFISFSQNETREIKEVNIDEDNVIEAISFRLVEELPLYPKCKNKVSRGEKKDCMILMMQKHITKHFKYKNVICSKKEVKRNKKKGKENNCIVSLKPS